MQSQLRRTGAIHPELQTDARFFGVESPCFSPVLALFSLPMNVDDAMKLARECADKMTAKYGGIVFDEWLIVRIADSVQILAHSGPRGEGLVEDFSRDTAALQEELLSQTHSIGDFGFTHEGHGTRFDAFVVIGENIFLLWNKIGEATAHITRKPSWKVAQAEFLAFTDIIRSNPVTA